MARLYRELADYSHTDYYPFHMPGHKRNNASVNGEFPFDRDITEIEGFDNLHHAEGILKEAQENAARLYGTKQCYYSVNGSTAALLSAVSAAVPDGGKILVARNCHKAVYHAMYLRNLTPVYIYPQTDENWWINGGISPDKVERMLAASPDVEAVLITSPTYDGVVSDVERIAEIVHRYDIPLIVDEAHGAHFHFSDYFPVSAAELGADVVVQSFHMGIYQTSSPSYILMASMDACIEKMEKDGHQMFRDFTRMLEKTRTRLAPLRYIRLVTPENGTSEIFDYDRSKLVFSTRYASLTGRELYQILLERYHIQMEMESEYYALAIAAVGDTEEGFERLCHAIEEIDEEQKEQAASQKTDKKTGQEEKTVYRPLSQTMTIKEAMEAPDEVCPLEESIGRISSEFAYLYPPGIPLIVPGEQITGQFVKNMRIYMNKGLYLQGLEDHSNRTIRVVTKKEIKDAQ